MLIYMFALAASQLPPATIAAHTEAAMLKAVALLHRKQVFIM